MVKTKEPVEEVSPATERLEAIVQESEFSPDTLAGDVRDTMLDLFRSRPKPWSAMTEAEQNDVVRALEYASRELVLKAVDAIRSTGTESPIRAILESYNEKDGIKAALKIKTMGEQDGEAAVLALHKARGKMVLVTLASADDYLGDRGDPAIMPDQSGLDFEAGADVGDDET